MDDAVIPLSVYLEAQKQTAEAIIQTARDTGEIRATMQEIRDTMQAREMADKEAHARWEVFVKLPTVSAFVAGMGIGGFVIFAVYPALLQSGLIEAAQQVVP